MSPEERRCHLQNGYGFICECPACVDPTGSSRARRERLALLKSSYAAYIDGYKGPHPLIPKNAADALRLMEHMIAILLEEGLYHMELARAFRTASMEAANLNKPKLAFEYAFDEEEIERNCLGTPLDDLVALGAAAACHIEFLEKRFGKEVNPRYPHANKENKKHKGGSKRKSKATKENESRARGLECEQTTEAKKAESKEDINKEGSEKCEKGVAQTEEQSKEDPAREKAENLEKPLTFFEKLLKESS
jgi:hypothetical protein